MPRRAVRLQDSRTAATCTGACTAGYACPNGSTNATAFLCPAGQYSLAAAGLCSPCPAGLYGSTPGMASAACTGACLAGYACPEGSPNATAVTCPPGAYSGSGASSCSLCGPGLYGASAAQSSALCSGTCAPGFACVPGSTNATAAACAPRDVQHRGCGCVQQLHSRPVWRHLRSGIASLHRAVPSWDVWWARRAVVCQVLWELQRRVLLRRAVHVCDAVPVPPWLHVSRRLCPAHTMWHRVPVSTRLQR